ncbi:MAG: hypothetical protein ACLPUG_16110 [Acidimicrobiales bacterium]
MTMLYSFYSSEGLIWAADSRITRTGQTRPEPSQEKVCRVPAVGVARGLIGYYGLAEVGHSSMAAWLAQMIRHWPGSHSPDDFANYVVDGLARETTPPQRKEVSGLHFGAFRSSEGRVEPVFFHIRNTYDFDGEKGVHFNIGDFWSEEQLMGRDVQRMRWSPSHVRNELRKLQQAQGLPLWYRNGDLAMFPKVTGMLQFAFMQIGHLDGYGSPSSLEAWETLARTMVITTTKVARCFSRAPFPTIGDSARVLGEPWPTR